MKVFIWILIGLALLRLVLMAVVPVFEPSEARYAAISANMARTGDYVVPRFTYDCEYQSFDGKPPLVFQAGGLFIRALGTEKPWTLQLGARLFPFLSALLVLLILFHAVKKFSDAATARLAVGICATTTAFFAAAGISMTDMTLTACVAGALLLYRCFTATPTLGYAAGVMALMGAGMIVKGPVALVLFGLPVLADACVNRHWKYVFNLKWLWTAPVFFAIAVPWFVLVEQRNPGSVLYFFYNENFLRFVSHDYGDKYGAGREAFRGVSILWALVATLPWSLVPVWEGVKKWRSRDKRHETRGPRAARGFRRLPDLVSRLSSLVPVLNHFEPLAILAIIGFWCLTSRVLLYYLFPVMPVFAAALALYGPRELLKKCFPWVALLTGLLTAGLLVGGMCFSEKMMGTKTPFGVRENHYANEFYHGTKTPEEIQRLREEDMKLMKEQFLRWQREQRLDPALVRPQSGAHAPACGEAFDPGLYGLPAVCRRTTRSVTFSAVARIGVGNITTNARRT